MPTNNNNGFIPLRRGLVDHLKSGQMKGRDLSTYVAIHFFADYETGVAYKLSAPFLAEFLNEKSVRKVQRSLVRLEQGGYIKRLKPKGGDPWYPIVIDKYLVKKCLSINAQKSLSLNEIAWSYIGECRSTVGRLSGIKEIKRITTKDYTPKTSKNLTPTPKSNKEKYGPDSNEARLSGLLLNLILERKPNFTHGQPNNRKQTIQRWAVHIDRLIRLNNRTPEQIEAVIRFCQQDDFWCNNILGGEKLRKQIDKLELKMQTEQAPVKPPRDMKRNAEGLTPLQAKQKERNLQNAG
jgi:hypothetical protein